METQEKMIVNSNGIEVTLTHFPTEKDWLEVKRRAWVTIGKNTKKIPESWWRHRILEARHSPIRRLMYSFYIRDVPYWVSVHLTRHHVGNQPYVQSQRNDRQDEYDRTQAPQDSPVDMIVDLNAEALMILANKRLCMLASEETRTVVGMMCMLAQSVTPEFENLLVPLCEYCNGKCHEMFPCGRYE